MRWWKLRSLRSHTRAISFVGFVVALATLCPLTSLAQLYPSGARLHVLVHDESDQPISGADVQLKRRDMVMTTGTTNQKGEAEFAELASGTYELLVMKAEFQTLKQDVLVKAGPPVEIEFILSPRLAAFSLEICSSTARLLGSQVLCLSPVRVPVRPPFVWTQPVPVRNSVSERNQCRRGQSR